MTAKKKDQDKTGGQEKSHSNTGKMKAKEQAEKAASGQARPEAGQEQDRQKGKGAQEQPESGKKQKRLQAEAIGPGAAGGWGGEGFHPGGRGGRSGEVGAGGLRKSGTAAGRQGSVDVPG